MLARVGSNLIEMGLTLSLSSVQSFLYAYEVRLTVEYPSWYGKPPIPFLSTLEFCRMHGFRVTGILPGDYSDDEDALSMEKRVSPFFEAPGGEGGRFYHFHVLG